MVGNSPFAGDFAAGGKRDSAGRSLRDLDLQYRLLRYRCSYMIYSPAFRGLPARLLQHCLRELDAALTGGARGSQLPADERQAIRGILADTLPEFAEIASSPRSGPPSVLRNSFRP